MAFRSSTVSKHFNFLYIRKREAIAMVALICAYSVAEFGGISLLVPIIQHISQTGSAQPTGEFGFIRSVLTRVMDFMGIPLNLAALLTFALLIILARQFFFYLREYKSAQIRNRATERIRTEVVRHVLRADLNFFLLQGQGNLLSAVTGQSARAGDTLLYVLKFLSSLTLIAIYVVLLAIIQPILALCSVAVFALSILLSSPFIRVSKKYSKIISAVNIRLMEEAGDKIYGIRLVKIFSREGSESAKISGLIKKLSDILVKSEVAGAKIILMSEPLTLVAILLIFYVGVNVLDMSLTRLGVFLFVLYRLNPHVKNINHYLQKVNAHSKSLDFLEMIVDKAKTSKPVESGSVSFLGLKKDIVFDDVSFSFEEAASPHFVLKNLSFRIPRGSFTAIVGPSGAGKSTLADLVPRFREITDGEIRLDGIPLKDYELKSLRSRIGYLSQEPFLFNDTVAENISYGFDESIRMEDITAAAVRAYAHDFVEAMPDGYETRLGDRGTRLSGGQKQRIVLARLILHDPDIIILDEYTSALDSESERCIQDVLAEMKRKKTMIVIAHRLATIKQAEQILVIDDGRLIESGDFNTLIGEEGSFKRLFEAQLFF